MMKIRAFLPCRKGSERVPKKNIKPFFNYKNGLIELKLNQLLASKCIDEILLSTNDEEIISYAESLNNNKIIIHKRAENLSGSDTSTDDLILHVLDLVTDGVVLWTHVTSPFITAEVYDDAISRYFEMTEKGYDSLMTTGHVHGFLWDESGPLNYDRAIEKWPRTQTINPLHEINSGIFINSVENYQIYKDRIGQKPYLMILDKVKGFDIDWNEDFLMAECLMESLCKDSRC